MILEYFIPIAQTTRTRRILEYIIINIQCTPFSIVLYSVYCKRHVRGVYSTSGNEFIVQYYYKQIYVDIKFVYVQFQSIITYQFRGLRHSILKTRTTNTHLQYKMYQQRKIRCGTQAVFFFFLTICFHITVVYVIYYMMQVQVIDNDGVHHSSSRKGRRDGRINTCDFTCTCDT